MGAVRSAGRLLATAALVVLTSCRVFDPSSRDPADLCSVPDVYAPAYRGMEIVPGRWWQVFGDADLERLVGAALTNNTSLAQAQARLAQAEVLAVQRGASRLPELAGEGSAAVTRRHRDGDAGGGDSGTEEAYALGLACSYELDLWGRVRAGAMAAQLDASARRADWEAAAMTLSAEVALRYLDLLASRQTYDLIERQREANRQTLELIELRFRRSQSTALDVFQQREVLAETEALLPLERARQETLQHELAVLLGVPPSSDLGSTARRLPAPPALPVAGLPAELLGRRPDVRAAWFRLRSAEWGVTAAETARLPAVRVTAGARYEDDSVAGLFDNWLLNLAGNLAAPVFDAGRRRADVTRSRAVTSERIAGYRDAVLKALQEVQDAMAREQGQAEHLVWLRRQLDLAGRSRRHAIDRYGKGQENYLRVLSAMLSEDRLRRRVVDAEYARLAYRVGLYRALGGDWTAIVRGLEQEPAGHGEQER